MPCHLRLRYSLASIFFFKTDCTGPLGLQDLWTSGGRSQLDRSLQYLEATRHSQGNHTNSLDSQRCRGCYSRIHYLRLIYAQSTARFSMASEMIVTRRRGFDAI